MTWDIEADADWIKTLRWDLPVEVESFLSVIGGPGQLVSFLALPAAVAMPDDLRMALVSQGFVEPGALPTPARPVSESLLQEHPGHSDQKVHGRWAHGGPGSQMTLGLRGKGVGGAHPRARGGGGGAALTSEQLTDAISSGSSYSLGDSPEERELLTGKIEDMEDASGGISATFTATINGKKVWLKPSDGMFPDELHDGIAPGTDHENEMASLLVDRELGGLVPTPTVVVRTGLPSVDGYTDDVGSFTTDASTRWLVSTNAGNGRSRGFYELDDEEKVRAAVFDEITGQCDRHGRNYTVYEDSGGVKFSAIDNGQSFSTGHPSPWNTDWMDEGGGSSLDSRTMSAVSSFVSRRSEIEPRLAALVGPDAADKTFLRAEYIRSTGMSMETSEFIDGVWDPSYSGGGGSSGGSSGGTW